MANPIITAIMEVTGLTSSAAKKVAKRKNIKSVDEVKTKVDGTRVADKVISPASVKKNLDPKASQQIDMEDMIAAKPQLTKAQESDTIYTRPQFQDSDMGGIDKPMGVKGKLAAGALAAGVTGGLTGAAVTDDLAKDHVYMSDKAGPVEKVEEPLDNEILGLVAAEGGTYDAKNPTSSAIGKGQWIKANWKPLEDAVNIKREDWYPKSTDSEEDKTRKSENQDKMLKKWWEWKNKEAKHLRKHDKDNKYSDDELAFMTHYLGLGGSKAWLKDGKQPPGQNVPVDKHVESYRKARDGQAAKAADKPAEEVGEMEDKAAPDVDVTNVPPKPDDPKLSPIQQMVKDLQVSNAVALEEYKKEKDAVRSREMWDGIVKGVTLIAAGLYGLNSGDDVSGVKFDPKDFSNQYRAAKEGYNAVLEGNSSAMQMQRMLLQANENELNRKFRQNKHLWDKAQDATANVIAERRMDLAEKTLDVKESKDLIKEKKSAGKLTTKQANKINQLHLQLATASGDKKEVIKQQLEPLYDAFNFKPEEVDRMWGLLGTRAPDSAERAEQFKDHMSKRVVPADAPKDVKKKRLEELKAKQGK